MLSEEENAMINITPSSCHVPSMDWLIYFKNPVELWADNWIALVLEILVTVLFLQVCLHAIQRHAKDGFMAVTLMFAAVGLELFQQIPNEGYQLWWYHQGTVNLIQHRLPTYVVFFFTVLYYWVDCMNEKMNLPVLTQSFINALTAISLWFPCLMLVPNLLLVMLHFDDPMFNDRLFNVSFCQLIVTFLLFFHVRHLHQITFDELKPQDRHFFAYIRCSVQSSVAAIAYSIVETYLLYVTYKIIVFWHLGCGLLTAIIIFSLLSKQEILERDGQGYTIAGFKKVLGRKEWRFIVSSFFILAMIPLLVKPENLKSDSERLELGPCDEIEAVSNMSPLDFYRKRYVCLNDTNSKFSGYDFHCMPRSEVFRSSDVRKRYTVCGVPFENARGLSKRIAVYGMFTLPLFYTLLSFSMNLDVATQNRMNCKKVD